MCPAAALALMGRVESSAEKGSCLFSSPPAAPHPDFGLDPLPNSLNSTQHHFTLPRSAGTLPETCIFCFFGTSDVLGEYFKIFGTITQDTRLPLCDVTFWNTSLYESYVISLSEFIVSDKRTFSLE